ncbi:MAG: hypothetical protein WDW36_003410 [Sanguina aurantia]
MSRSTAVMPVPFAPVRPPNVGAFAMGSVRASFAVGSRLMPTRTLDRAARLFSTPYASSRRRAAAAAPDAEMRRAEITLSGRRIVTYTWGNPITQPYVLLVHGWSSFGLRYLAWVPHLRALGYAVIAFDQPGHGLSEGKTSTLPDFIKTTSEIGRCFGHAALAIGHSLGGAAVVMAQSQAWRAHRMILLAPMADMVAAADRFISMVHLGVHLRAPFFDLHEQHTGVHPQDLQTHHHLRTLGQPGLIVHDLDDGDVPWEEGERCARHWSTSRLLTTQGLGHHLVLDAPEVIDASLAFLRGEPVGNRVEAPGYQRTTITAWILMGTAVNITHKTLCALVIGLYGFEPHSWTQLALVVCLQGALLAYLCLVKPYLSRGLQLLEVVCHASEMVVFLGAAASLHWEASPAVTYVMLGGFSMCIISLVVSELVKVVAALRLCWNALRTWLATQWHSHPRPTDEAILHAQQPEYEEGLHRQGSVPASVTRLPSKSLPHRRASQVVGPSSVTSMHEPQKISFDCPHWEEGNE